MAEWPCCHDPLRSSPKSHGFVPPHNSSPTRPPPIVSPRRPKNEVAVWRGCPAGAHVEGAMVRQGAASPWHDIRGGGWCSGRAIFGMAVDPSGCVDARRGIDIGGVGAPDARYLAWRWTRQDTRGFLLVRGGARSYGRVPGSPRPVGGGSAVARLRGNGGVTPVRSRVGASGQRGSDELDIRGAFIFEGLSRLYARS